MNKLIRVITILFALSVGINGLTAMEGTSKEKAVSKKALKERPEVIGKMLEAGQYELLMYFVDTIADPLVKCRVIASLLADKRTRGGSLEASLKKVFGYAWHALDMKKQKQLLAMMEEVKLPQAQSDLLSADKDLLAYKMYDLAYGWKESEEETEIWQERKEQIADLLKKGANVNAITMPVVTAEGTSYQPWVLYAITHCEYELAQMLLKAGSTLTEDEKVTAITEIAKAWEGPELTQEKMLCAAQIIAETKLDPNIKDEQGWTPLMVVASENDTESAKRLLLLGAEIDIKTKDGWTPLTGALQNKNSEMVKALIEAGARPHFTNASGEAPLHFAGNETKTIMTLLERGANINKRDDVGHTPLMHMAMEDADEGTSLLLERGADVLKVDNKNKSALHHAANNNALKVVQLLLEKTTIDVNGKNDKSFTPLMMAAIEASSEMVQLLLDAGADKTIQNNKGQTALDLAVLHNRKEIAKLLE